MKYLKQRTVLAALMLGVAFSSYAGTKAWVQIKNESSYPLSLRASQFCIHDAKNGAFDDQAIPPNSSYPAQGPAEIDSTSGGEKNRHCSQRTSSVDIKIIAGRDKYARCTVYMGGYYAYGANKVSCTNEGLNVTVTPDFSSWQNASTQASPIRIVVHNQ